MFYLDCGLKPPSVNHLYGRTWGGQNYLKPEAVQFKNTLGLMAKTKWNKPLLTGRLSVDIIVCYGDNRRRDIDNSFKMILDSLKGIIIADDSQFDCDRIRRLTDKEPRLIIRIEPLAEDFQEQLKREINGQET